MLKFFVNSEFKSFIGLFYAHRMLILARRQNTILKHFPSHYCRRHDISGLSRILEIYRITGRY